MTGRQAPRPKRGGEEFARTHYAEDEAASSSKKVRFDTRNPAALAADAPEDDAVLDADVIGRRGAKAKRSAVNIDGFESDSSNEGFDARATAKSKDGKSHANGSKDEEDEDMFADVEEKEFADGDDDENLRREGKKRKDVKLADMDDISGQVMSSKSGGHISANVLQNPNSRGKNEASESESSSEDDEEGRAALDEDMDEELGAGSKKKHAPRLDAFNLNEEKEEGAIDEHHNYVRKAADPDAVYDNWLEGTSRRDMRRAKEAHDRRERERRAKDQEDDEVLTSDILRNLIPYLELGETVMEALARLGRRKSGKSVKVPKWKTKKKRAAEMEVDESAEEDHQDKDEEEEQRRQAVEAITDSADRLMKRGHEEIYDEEREVLTRLYKRETGEDWVDAPTGGSEVDAEGEAGVKNWEYRWSDARDGGETHGPYDGTTMEAWNAAGYFGDGVEFRRAGDETGSWRFSVQFT